MTYTHISGSHYMTDVTHRTVRPEQPAMPSEVEADVNRDVEVDPYENQGNLGVMVGIILLVTFAVIALVVFASTGSSDSSML